MRQRQRRTGRRAVTRSRSWRPDRFGPPRPGARSRHVESDAPSAHGRSTSRRTASWRSPATSTASSRPGTSRRERCSALLYQGGSWIAGSPAFTEDGSSAYVQFADHVVRLTTDADEWAALACDLIGQPFTTDEWRLHAPPGTEPGDACPVT